MDLVIAVDGPAASGKGTIGSRLAEFYGLPHLDTGLLYRAVGVRAVAPGRELSIAEAIEAAASLEPWMLDNPALTGHGAGELASRVAVIPQVRAALLEFQRRFAEQPGGAVLDGRDIGTVIAPRATAKLFVTATPEVRAERRWRQLVGQGETADLASVLADIRRRDERDSGREAAPLVQAPDATLLDTSDLTISEAVDAARRIVEAARARREASSPTG